MAIVAYRITPDSILTIHGTLPLYELIMPTGRWKLVSGPIYDNEMFVEHINQDGMTVWVNEHKIEFLPKRHTFTYPEDA